MRAWCIIQAPRFWEGKGSKFLSWDCARNRAMVAFHRRSWREVDRLEPPPPLPHPRGDSHRATTSERADFGLQTGDPPLEEDWPEIVGRGDHFELVFKILCKREGEILSFHSYMVY